MSTCEQVGVGTVEIAEQFVVAGTAIEYIAAAPTGKPVVAVATQNRVVAEAAGPNLIRRHGFHHQDVVNILRQQGAVVEREAVAAGNIAGEISGQQDFVFRAVGPYRQIVAAADERRIGNKSAFEAQGIGLVVVFGIVFHLILPVPGCEQIGVDAAAAYQHIVAAAADQGIVANTSL